MGLLVYDGFWVHALLWSNVPEIWVTGGVVQPLRVGMRARVIANEMKVVPRRRGDAERLLHQTIRLVPIPIGTIIAATP